jgi:molybdate transport system substrate-binding protein
MSLLNPFPVLLFSLTLLWLPSGVNLGAERIPTIAAAASLRDVLPALVDAFAREGGVRPRLSFGASGNLRRQISQGAPFELFLSADEDFVLDLAAEGRTDDQGAVYALGRLAILTRKGSSLRADGNLKDLKSALDDGRLGRLSIANPEHAPYGLAAREALERLGLWDRLQGHLVMGENVSQAAQFAVVGSAGAGIVAYSLAKSPRLAACCEHAPIAAELHAPLRQRGVLIRGAGEAARSFFRFLLGLRGRAILKEYGFGIPADAA